MTDEQVDVFGWLADRTGCGTLRVMQPFDNLQNETGIVVSYDEKMDRTGLMPKVIVGQRVCKTAPSQLWQALSRMETRPKLVYELDDDLWNVDPSNPRAFEWYTKGYDRLKNQYHDVQGNIEYNLMVADRVTVTTPALAKIVGEFNDDVRIIPNYLPRWVSEFERPRRENVTVGWMGSATHAMDWETSSNQIRRFLERNPEVGFHMIGGNYGDWLKLPKGRVIETPWIPTVEDCWKAIDFDIALAPLRPHVFNQSKSNLKALEAAALGIPIVASDCGPYPDFVEHGKTGFLVKRDHEWGTFLRDLVNDEAMRTELGANAREKAKLWVLEDHVQEWKDALCEW